MWYLSPWNLFRQYILQIFPRDLLTHFESSSASLSQIHLFNFHIFFGNM